MAKSEDLAFIKRLISGKICREMAKKSIGLFLSPEIYLIFFQNGLYRRSFTLRVIIKKVTEHPEICSFRKISLLHILGHFFFQEGDSLNMQEKILQICQTSAGIVANSSKST